MRYVQPQIIGIEKALTKVQSIGSSEPIKTPDIYVEGGYPPTLCTIAAYEADE